MDIDSFILQSYQGIYRYIRRGTRDDATASDLTQETYLRAVGRIRNKGPPRNERAWLLTIARNVLADHGRRSRPRHKPLDVAEEYASGEPGKIESLVTEEDALRVRDARDSLSERDRFLINSYYWEGQGCAEIGSALGATREVVKVRLFRARQRLARQLYDYNGEAETSPGP